MSNGEQNKQQQNFVMTADAPRFATRILATANPDSVIFSFGVENPTNRHEAHMHTRIAMPLSAVKSFADLLNRIISDVEMKKSLQGMDYSHIPSDA